MELGAKIRELRKKQNISIDQLSEKTGLSKGLISQIERDITGPSVTSLWKICQAMNVTMNYFFDDNEGINQIVRKEDRKKIMMKNGDRVYELLSPNHQRQIEMLWIEIEANESNSEKLITHEGDECGVVLEGSLRVISGDQIFDLETGDSIYLDSSIPHRYVNIGNQKSVSVWAMVPPSF